MKNITQQIKIVVLGLAVAAGVSYAVAWTGPGSAPPPAGNVPAPLNTGSSAQTKLGSLIINGSTGSTYPTGLTTFGLSNFYGQIVIMDGSQGAGKVLQSNASGLASWVSTSSLGIAASGSGSTGTGSGGSATPAVRSISVTNVTATQAMTGSTNTASVVCPTGSKVIGGGGYNADNSMNMINNGQTANVQGWTVEFQQVNGASKNTTDYVYAECLSYVVN